MKQWQFLFSPEGEGSGGESSSTSGGGNGPGASTHGYGGMGGPGGPGRSTAFGPPSGTPSGTPTTFPTPQAAEKVKAPPAVTDNPDGTHSYDYTKGGIKGLSNQLQQQGQGMIQTGQDYSDAAQKYLQGVYGQDPTLTLKSFNNAANDQASRTAGMTASNAAGEAVNAARSGGLNAGQAGLAGGQSVGQSYTDSFQDSLAKQLDLLSGFRGQNVGAAGTSIMNALQQMGLGVQSQGQGLGGLESAAGLNQQQQNQQNQANSNMLNGLMQLAPILGAFFL